VDKCKTNVFNLQISSLEVGDETFFIFLLAYHGSLEHIVWELHARLNTIFFVQPFMELMRFLLGGSMRGKTQDFFA
jgi:hypothetical protein